MNSKVATGLLHNSHTGHLKREHVKGPIFYQLLEGGAVEQLHTVNFFYKTGGLNTSGMGCCY